MDRALALYGDLLGGTVGAEGGAEDGSWHWVDVTWSTPLSIRLVAPGGTAGDTVARFLDGRAGRLHHLDLSVDDPDQIPGASPAANVIGVEQPVWVVAPEDNLGTRLVLRARGGA